MLTIARTLMIQPECLLIDEPTEGLAPQFVERIDKILRELKARSIGILLVAQSLHFALSLADRVYVMAKGGLISFTQALAGAYSPKGIRVNAICPGVVLTERVRSRFTEGNQIRFGGIDNIAGQYPFAVGQPEDIANVALFLASDESRMVNGATIPTEGGFSAY